MLAERSATSARGAVSPLNMTDWNDRNRTFDVIAGYVPSVGGMVMTGADGLAENVTRQWVTAGFFDALGIRPIAGRTFLPEDDARRASVVVLSEAFWRSRFNADPGHHRPRHQVRRRAVHRRRGRAAATSSCSAARASGPCSRFSARRRRRARRYQFRAIGRMKPGVTIEAARADLAAVADGLAQEFPATNKDRGITVEPLHDALIGRELRSTARCCSSASSASSC